MMHKFIIAFLLAFIALTPSAWAKAPAHKMNTSFISLCYHNIEDVTPDQSYEGVSSSKLVEQLSWLKHEGYQAVSMDDILAAQAGRKSLPPKAMLLTFDDGYASFYTRVYPILKMFNYPAVLAVVDQWLEEGTSKQHGTAGEHMVKYGTTTMPRSFFLTWDQIKEMSDSGLVEIASHSDALHLGIPSNPFGNTEPAAISAGFDTKSVAYETRADFQKRIMDDLQRSSTTIKEKTGKAPRIMVWPYGAHNDYGIAVAAKNGMPITFTLNDGTATVTNLKNVPRQLITRDPEIGDFATSIRQINNRDPMRAVQVDLDYVYDANPEQMSRNIDQLISRIFSLQINHVYLQAFSNPEGDGLARKVYFPNRHMPMRADIFNRVVWQLKTRANVNVYGWLPVLSFDFGREVQYVQAFNNKTGEIRPDARAYKRLSPFDNASRKLITELYEDMARAAPIDGLLFHDDALLSDFEDASPSALEAYRRNGLPTSLEVITANPDMFKKWTTLKTTTLINFTQELKHAVEQYHQPIRTVRNIYAPVVLKPESQAWFAQDYDRFLETYDYTAIEAMPRLEHIDDDDADAWLQQLVAAASRRPNGLSKTVFELQTVDWNIRGDASERAIPAETLAAQMRLLARQGGINLAYYPDDFVTNTPDVSVIHKDFSLQNYPYQP